MIIRSWIAVIGIYLTRIVAEKPRFRNVKGYLRGGAGSVGHQGLCRIGKFVRNSGQPPKLVGHKLALCCMRNVPLTLTELLTMAMELKFKPRKGIYANYNSNCTFNPKTIEAWSYQWWQFVRVYGDQTVFNWHNYSRTTLKHQWAVRSLLKQLGITNVFYVDCPRGLQHRDALKEALEMVYRKISKLEIASSRKGCRTVTKSDNALRLRQLHKDAAKLRKLKAKLSEKKQRAIFESEQAAETERLKEQRLKRQREDTEQRQNLIDDEEQTFHHEYSSEPIQQHRHLRLV